MEEKRIDGRGVIRGDNARPGRKRIPDYNIHSHQ